jgi:hypothetical protein
MGPLSPGGRPGRARSLPGHAAHGWFEVNKVCFTASLAVLGVTALFVARSADVSREGDSRPGAVRFHAVGLSRAPGTAATTSSDTSLSSIAGTQVTGRAVSTKGEPNSAAAVPSTTVSKEARNTQGAARIATTTAAAITTARVDTTRRHTTDASTTAEPTGGTHTNAAAPPRPTIVTTTGTSAMPTTAAAAAATAAAATLQTATPLSPLLEPNLTGYDASLVLRVMFEQLLGFAVRPSCIHCHP